jgi:hypothetical protein
MFLLPPGPETWWQHPFPDAVLGNTFAQLGLPCWLELIEAASVDRLVVGGVDVVRSGSLVRADEQEIAREHRKQAGRLWQ